MRFGLLSALTVVGQNMSAIWRMLTLGEKQKCWPNVIIIKQLLFSAKKRSDRQKHLLNKSPVQ